MTAPTQKPAPVAKRQSAAVQKKKASSALTLPAVQAFQHSSAPIQKKENNTGLPNNLKTGIEGLSGFSMDDVKVHYNSHKPAQLNALAYAQGSDIHVGAGQEKHLPHEAWHVVQQKQGRVQATMQLKGISINDDKGLEKEADVMGQKAIQMVSKPAARTSNEDQKGRNTAIAAVDNVLYQRKTVGEGIIQKQDSYDTLGGTFSVERYKAVEEKFFGTVSVGADIRLIFTPNANCPKDITIGLIQIVKLEDGMDTYSSELQEELMRHRPWAVDRAKDSNPVYGSYDKKGQKSQTLTDNPPEKDPVEDDNNNRFGRSGKKGTPAVLEDTPVHEPIKNKKQGQYFETTAMVLDGPYQGMTLGTVSWGYTKPAGQKEAEILPFELVKASGRSDNFEQAKEVWNALADKKGLVPIPDENGGLAPAPQKKCGCFLTTACVEHMGLSDDCEELTVLRQFRDTYLLNKPNGNELIELYYTHSPTIVTAIHKRDDEDEILKRLYRIIRGCVDAIKNGHNEWAFQTYCTMVVKLKEEFIPECPVPEVSF